MSLDYIRIFYGVPAKRGARVRYTAGYGEVMEGRIVGSSGHYLRIRFPDRKCSLRCHPTWQIEYLPETVSGEL